MESNTEKNRDIVITGKDAEFLNNLFGLQTSDQMINEELDNLFESALFAEFKNDSGAGAFKDYHWRFAHLRDAKKIISMLFKYVNEAA